MSEKEKSGDTTEIKKEDSLSSNELSPYFTDSGTRKSKRIADAERTKEVPSPSLRDLKEIADYLDGNLPSDIVDNHGGYFGLGGMLKDAYDAYGKGDTITANAKLGEMYKHVGEGTMHSELECWIQKLTKKIFEDELAIKTVTAEIADEGAEDKKETPNVLDETLAEDKREMSAILDRIAKKYGPVVSGILDFAYNFCLTNDCMEMDKKLYCIEERIYEQGKIPEDIQELITTFKRTCYFKPLEETLRNTIVLGVKDSGILNGAAMPTALTLQQIGVKLQSMDYEDLQEQANTIAQKVENQEYATVHEFIEDFSKLRKDFYQEMFDWSKQIADKYSDGERLNQKYAGIAERCSRVLGVE